MARAATPTLGWHCRGSGKPEVCGACARHGHEHITGSKVIGRSDNNRSERQGGLRKETESKEVCSKGTTLGTRTGSEAAMRAISVRKNAKSNCHRKTHRVEPEGAGRMFMHLTRGGPWPERDTGVSRGHCSVESPGNGAGAKGRRTKRGQSAPELPKGGREGLRHGPGAATAAATRTGGRRTAGWIPRTGPCGKSESTPGRKEAAEDAQ